jgi:SAM-dependent methyltransferase
MPRVAHKVGDYGGLKRATGPERARLKLLAEGLDPETQRWLADIGIGRGWRCLEVGAAEGSMSRWLAEQVGPEGHVVAADIDVRFLDNMDLPNVEVRQLDLRSDPLEKQQFDLAYCRTLLLHLPEPAAAVCKLVDALRAGGVMLAHEPDMCLHVANDPDHPDAELFARFHREGYAHLRRIKRMDTQFGRTLPGLLRDAGLVDVRSHASASLLRGDSVTARHMRIIFSKTLGPILVGDGVVTQAELDRVLDCYGDPEFEYLNGLQIVAWGRKPG